MNSCRMKTPSPEALYTTQESVRLAFMTVLQKLPPRQRAVMMLRDVLGVEGKRSRPTP